MQPAESKHGVITENREKDYAQERHYEFRSLSVEPLWAPVKLPLFDIDWVIVGGKSGSGAKPFEGGHAANLLHTFVSR